jgi:hypothetical protein
MTGDKPDMEKVRQYRFEPYGPFEMPLEDGPNIAAQRLRDFWTDIELKHPGLPEALGCYVFGIRKGTLMLPWYVGKTEQKSFRFESVQPHKLQHYHDALMQQPGGTALLFLIPRLTDGGKFRKVWTSGSSSVARLEQMLIETAISRNPRLVNQRMIKHLTLTVVPGYRNEPVGSRTPEAEDLAALLGTPQRAGAKKRARRENHLNHPMPAKRERLTLRRGFDNDEYERLKLGLIPETMDDKWFIYFDEHSMELRFHRSWTGYCIYIVTVAENGHGCEIKQAWVNADREQYPSEDRIHDVNVAHWIIDALLLGNARDFPNAG